MQLNLFCLKNKFLLANLLSRNLKVKYKRSILGVLWTVMNPLLNVAVYYFVFKHIFHVSGERYGLSLFAGVLPWSFFSQSLFECIDSIEGNRSVLNKSPIPGQIFPLVATLTNFVGLFSGMFVILVGCVIFGSIWLQTFFIVLFFLSLLLLNTYFIGLILSMLFIYLQDTKYIVTVAIQLLFFLTPVVYNQEMLPKEILPMLYINPVGAIFGSMQDAILNKLPSIRLVVAALVWTIFCGIAASIMIKRKMPNLIEAA